MPATIATPQPEGAPSAADSPLSPRPGLSGLLYALGAYGSWALFPLYFKAILNRGCTPVEALLHRVVWGVWVVGALLLWSRRFGEVRTALREPRALRSLLLSTVLIGVNWYVYAWAVASNHVLEGSLGYFINPLVNVAFGVLLLGERLTRAQIVAIALAAVGVAWLTIGIGRPPWLALVLAASFGSYALVRKRAHVEALPGLFIETAIMFPLALGWFLLLLSRGRSAFAAGSPATDTLLILAGVVTVIPLLWFTAAARRLTLVTLGLLQYLAPTGQFLLAVFAFHEPFTRHHAVAFALIWTGLAVVSVDAIRRARRGQACTIEDRPASEPDPPPP